MDLGTLQRMHPEWNIVDFKEAPNGGIWALGSDGGVFALDATGGNTGITAPFYGSYHSELAKYGRTGETNKFQRLDLTPNGGYQLVSTNQQIYGAGGEFSPPPPAPLVSAPAASTTGTTQATDTSMTAPASVSGEAAIRAVLEPVGLGSLVGPALTALRGTPGADASWVTQVWLPQQQTYKDLFPEIGAAQQKLQADPTGRTHVPTPAEIVSYRNTAQQMADQGIIPAEFVSNDQISKLINGGVSLPEFQRRVLNGYSAIANGDAATRDAFLDYHGAVDLAHAVGAFLDPTIGEEAVNRAIAQAEVGGAARRTNFGPISAEQATGLAAAGHGTEAEFQRLYGQRALTEELAGEGEDLTQQTQLSSLTSGAAAEELENRRKRRQANFQGGGGAMSGGGGRTGLSGT